MNYLPAQESPSYIHTREGMFITGDFVLAVELRGVVTEAGITGLMRHIKRCSSYMLSFVVLLDKAVLTAGRDYLDEIDPSELSSLPGAIVVSEVALPGVNAYARRVAEYGIVRAGFTARNEALSWAARQAQVHEAEMVWAAHRSSVASAS